MAEDKSIGSGAAYVGSVGDSLVLKGFRDEDWDCPVRLLLVVLVGRIGFDGDIPNSVFLDWVLHFPNAH